MSQQHSRNLDLTTLQYRIETVERDIQQLKSQFQLYVPSRENDLILQSIKESVKRIEDEVAAMKLQLAVLTGQLSEQEQNAQKLQIRILWGAVSIIITIAVSVLVFYLTHLIR